MSKNIFQWIWFGIFLRLLVMPFSCHPDLFINFANTFHLVETGIVDGYKFLVEYHGDEKAMFFLYDPLHYLVVGLWSGVTGLLTGPEYQVWMREIIDSMLSNHLEKIFSFPGSEIKFKTLFIWKCLYLGFDLLVLFCVLKFLPGEKEKESFVSLWAGSLILIYSLYLFGQSGVVPAALIMAGLALYYRGVSLKWVGFCFALSVPFKLFSLLILPLPYLLARGRKEKTETALYSLLPLIAIYTPFAIHSEGLVFWRLYGGYATYATEGITWNWILIGAKVILGMGYLAVCYHAWRRSMGNPEDLSRYLFIILLLLLSVPLKIYYYVWVIPFWFLFLNEKKVYRPIYLAVIFLLFFSNLSTKQTFIGIMAPLEHDFFMSFPGWMDIAYFFFPSGLHVKLSVLAIFLLTLSVVCDQILILFGRKPLFQLNPRAASTGTRPGWYLLTYPAVLFAVLGMLITVSHPSLKPYFKNYLFTNSGTPYTWNFLANYDLVPGTSMTQEITLLKGRIKDIRYLVEKPYAGPVRVEVFTQSGGEEESLYLKDFDQFNKGWEKFILEPNLLRDKTAWFRITNRASRNLDIPVYRLPERLGNFNLTYEEVSGQVKPILQGVLPLIMTEEPEFFYKSETILDSILNSLFREKGFLVLWMILTVFCFAQSIRYLIQKSEKSF